MKVRVNLTIEVDPENWELAYGVGRENLVEDVHTYVIGAIQDSAAANEGGIVTVTDMTPNQKWRRNR